MKLLIAGGGTGGHVFPALAVAQEWLSRGQERQVVFVGTQRGLEAKLVPQAGLPLETIRVAGLKGMGGAQLMRNAATLVPALRDTARIFRRQRFDAAFGTGGYVAGPVMFLAVMKSLPTVIFEPNAEPGLTNRVLARMATRIATAYGEPAERWGGKARVTGCPVRPEFFLAPKRLPAPPFRILITGGSQGALPINRAVVEAMDGLAGRKQMLSIVHQTGERDYNAVRTAYARREIHAEVVPFILNMAERFAAADLIVCRAGAITVAELAAAGRAAIVIPFGRATDSHQLRNAEWLEGHGAARLIREEELTGPDAPSRRGLGRIGAGERLRQEVFALLDAPQRLARMAECAKSLARPQATQDIVNLIEEAARQ